MNIHEYQAKALLRTYGAPVSDGRVVLKADEAKTAAGELDGPLWVVKAQIHAGGRGKGSFKEADAGEKGGVRLTKSVEEAAEEAKKMLGRTLVTHQTGPAGKRCVDCAYFACKKDERAKPAQPVAHCAKLRKLTRKKTSPKFGGFVSACRYFVDA